MFLPFLPEDNLGIDRETLDVLECINEDLASLLQQDCATFWQSLSTERSLQACLASYLQYTRCSQHAELGVQ